MRKFIFWMFPIIGIFLLIFGIELNVFIDDGTGLEQLLWILACIVILVGGTGYVLGFIEGRIRK